MKKYLWGFPFFALLLGAFLFSCQREDVSSTAEETATDAVTATAARYAAQIDSVTSKHCKGKLTAIDSTALPAAVLSYLSTNYPKASIAFAGTDASGKYVVGIVVDGQPKGLLFDASGTFTKLLEHYGKRAQLTPVATADLPATITTYISTNYEGATIKKAGINADGTYFVAISTSDTVKVLVFDASGSFKEEQTPPKGKGHRGRK